MTMRFRLWYLAVAACGAFGSTALAQSDPAEVARKVYTSTAASMAPGYGIPMMAWVTHDLFVKVIGALAVESRRPDVQDSIAAGRDDYVLIAEEFATGCVGCRELTDIDVTARGPSGGSVTVEVRYRLDGTPKLMLVDMLLVEAEWRVDNVRSPDDSWNLRRRLEQSLSKGE